MRTFQWILLEVTPEYTRSDSLIIRQVPSWLSSRRDRSSRFTTTVTISTAVIGSDAPATRRRRRWDWVRIPSRWSLDISWPGIDRHNWSASTAPISTNDYSILSGMVTTKLRYMTSRRMTERDHVDFVNWISVFRGTKKKWNQLNWIIRRSRR